MKEALVCYRGSPTSVANEKLARLLPVRWTPGNEQRYHVKMTDQGRDLHWLADVGWQADVDPLAQLPSLADAADAQRSKPLAIVLATGTRGTGDSSPVVVYQPYGAGRVVVIEGVAVALGVPPAAISETGASLSRALAQHAALAGYRRRSDARAKNEPAR